MQDHTNFIIPTAVSLTILLAALIYYLKGTVMKSCKDFVKEKYDEEKCKSELSFETKIMHTYARLRFFSGLSLFLMICIFGTWVWAGYHAFFESLWETSGKLICGALLFISGLFLLIHLRIDWDDVCKYDTKYNKKKDSISNRTRYDDKEST